MSVVEAPDVDLQALGVVMPKEGEYTCRVDESRLVVVVRAVTDSGRRLVVDGMTGSGEVEFSVIDAYVPPAADTAEALPPQCSF